MKKRNLLITICMVILSLCLLAVGCGDETSTTPPTLSLDKTTISVMEGESKDLVATVENFEGQLIWSSSSTEIATVDSNGKVLGVKPGTATITVKAEEVTASCVVNVTKNESFPVITVEHESIDLYVNGTFAVKASATRNNLPYSAQFTYSTSNPQVATVSAEGVITAVSYGTATIYVAIDFEGQIVEKAITVNVNVDLDVALDASALKLATGEVLKDGNVGEQQINLTISEKGTDLTDKVVTWKSENENVALVSSNGYGATVTAVNKGLTNVVASFEHEGKTIEYFVSVECYVPYYQINKDVFVDISELDSGATTAELIFDGVEISTIDAVTYNGEDLTENSTVSENGISVPVSKLEKGVKEIKIETEKTGYVAQLVYADMVMSSKEDLLEFAKIYKDNNSDCYYALSADIDMLGENVTTAEGSTWTNSYPWTATLDGRGFSIRNIKYTHGFVPQTTSGVVKNLAIINAQKAVNGGGLIANTFNGLLSNVFVQGTIEIGNNQAGLIFAGYNNARVENVVALVEYTAGGSVALFGANSSTSATAVNTIVISKSATQMSGVTHSASNVGFYKGVVDFLNDEAFKKESFKGFWADTEYLPLMDSVKETIDYQAEITTSLTSVSDGDTIIANKSNAEFKLKNEVAGVSITSTGVVSIDVTVPAGTSITVQACIYGRPVSEKTFATIKSVQTDKAYDIDMSKTGEIDVSLLGITDVTKVDSLIVDGVSFPFTTSGTKLIVEGDTFSVLEAGLNKVLTIVTTDYVAYKAKANVAQRVLGSKEDVIEFAKAYSTIASNIKALVILSANIDMEGTNVTTTTGSTWTVANSWCATFDGRGYSISNIAYTHGLFPLIAASGVIRNVAIINAQKAINGGGLIANETNGTVENVFVHGTIESSSSLNSQAGLAHAAYTAAKFINCVVMVEYTGAGLNALFGGPSAAGVTVKNVIAISKTATQITGGLELANASNVGLYESVAEFLQDSDFDKSAFTGVWTDTTGLPLMKGIDTDGEITNKAEKVISGERITGSNALATFELASAVEGITITENGQLTIAESVATDTEFTVVMKVFGAIVDQRTYKVNRSIEVNATVVVDLSKEFEIDLAKLDESLTDATAVKSITIDGVNAQFTTSGSILVIDGATLTGATAGYGKYVIITLTNGTIYKVKANVATLTLGSKQDVLDFAIAYKNVATNANALVMLTANIDMEGTNLTTYTDGTNASTWTIATDWTATFDGQGYSISNVAYTHGFFPMILKGTVKNLTVLNAQKAVNGGGLVTNELNGTVENVYFQGTIESSAQTTTQGGLTNALRAGAKVNNVVILVEYTEYRADQNALVGAQTGVAIAFTELKNVIVISNTAPKLSNSTIPTTAVNVNLYTSVAKLKEDTNLDKSSFVGVWTDNSGVPMMQGIATGKITTTATTVVSGDKIIASNQLAIFSLKTAVAGVSISADGTLTIENSVAPDTELTVVAIVAGIKIDEKTFKVDSVKNKTSVVFNLETKANSIIDLTKLDTGLTAESVTLVEISGVSVEFTKNGTSLEIASTAMANVVKGKQNMTITTTGSKYLTTANVATMFIDSKEELISFYANQYSNKAGELYVLTTDIDMAGTSLVDATVSGNRTGDEATYAWFATFDGQGHVISNATYYHGFLPTVNGGVIKNLGLVNPTDTYDDISAARQVGLVARFVINAGVIENVYVKATGVADKRIAGIAARIGTTTTDTESVVRNSVVIIENATSVTDGGFAASYNLKSNGQVANVFGVSAVRTNLANATNTTNSAVYTSIAELNGASVVATTLVTADSVWSVSGGSLYFGSTIVG